MPAKRPLDAQYDNPDTSAVCTSLHLELSFVLSVGNTNRLFFTVAHCLNIEMDLWNMLSYVRYINGTSSWLSVTFTCAHMHALSFG
jgi:hypothetical protein